MMIKVIGSFVELPLYLQETVLEMFHNLPIGGRQKTENSYDGYYKHHRFVFNS